MLVSTSAQQGATPTTCEGRGQVTGTLSGVNLTLTSTSMTYDNCPGPDDQLAGAGGRRQPDSGSAGNRANVLDLDPRRHARRRRHVRERLPGFSVHRGDCRNRRHQRHARPDVRRRRAPRHRCRVRQHARHAVYGPAGGSRRTYGACSPVAGTYQAFFSGTDANGNRIRAASPLVFPRRLGGGLVFPIPMSSICQSSPTLRS